MRKFLMRKLVRDKIVSTILKGNKSNKVNYKVLNKKEFLKNLKEKFFEELEELDLNNKKNAVEELADLQLIIDTCLKTLKVSPKDFKKVFNNKNQRRGKLDKKIYIESVVIDEKDDWIPYYEKEYKKYREVK